MSAGVVLTLGAAAARTAPAAVLASLQRLEAELENEWAELQKQGHGYEALRLPAEASEDERAALRAGAEAQAAFLDRLDAYQRIRNSHFVDEVSSELSRAMETMERFYGRRRARRLRRRHQRLERLAARYRELEPLYGTPKDHKRIVVYQRFYAGVVAFSEQIRALDPSMPQSPRPSLVDRLYAFGRLVAGIARQVGPASRLVVAFVRALVVVLGAPTRGPGTPFTRRVDDLFRAWGDVQRLDVAVEGRERIQDGSAEVTLFAPAHRHGVTDNVTFSHLGLSSYLVFNAVDQLPVLPQLLKDRIAQTAGLIAVGGGRGSAVEQALAALEKGLSRNLLIYPEGSVSEGFRGTRPPRAQFGDGLVRRLREAGHCLRIVPLTYLDNARFLDLPSRSRTARDRLRRVAVGGDLGSDRIDMLLEVGGGAFVNSMVRLAWLEELVTDERHFLGMDRTAEIEKRLDLELDGIRYWGSLESAPTPDLLVTRSSEPVVVGEEPFHGKRVRVFQLPASAAGEDGRIVLESLAAEGSRELLLGIRPPAHIYLSVGRQRFDGDILRPLQVKERDAIFPGIVVRFVGVPVKSVNAIRRTLDEYSGREQRTLTCANSACRLIARAANIRIDDHADLRPFLPSHVLPTRTIRKLIERGVRNHAGQPVEVQIYKTDGRSLEAILAEARTREIRILRDHLEMFSVGVWRSLRATLASWSGGTPRD